MGPVEITEWDQKNNPYLVEYGEFVKEPKQDIWGVKSYYKRTDCIRKYGFAIPTYEAIKCIKTFIPDVFFAPEGVIELGAGSGYWSYLLRTIGVKVRAFDPAPGGTVNPPNEYSFWKSWTEIEKGDHTVLNQIPDAKKWALLLCWPDYDVDWPAQALDLYPGNVLIYIGEGPSGCTGNNRFHKILQAQWKTYVSKRIPKWPGIHDCLEIYVRNYVQTAPSGSAPQHNS